MPDFTTIQDFAEAEQNIKHSRFIGRCQRADTPGLAMEFLASVSEPKANHNCFAYRIGGDYRFSDDGEPGGSAGRPILTAIESSELDHVVVVVIRYFGGIKLGVGGLVRAYRGAAAACLDAAQHIVIRPPVCLEIDLPLAVSGAALSMIHHLGATEQDVTVSGDRYRSRLYVSRDILDTCIRHLTDKTRGQARINILEKD